MRTHCPHGHPYNEANTYAYRGKKLCRTCRRTTMLRVGAERKASGHSDQYKGDATTHLIKCALRAAAARIFA